MLMTGLRVTGELGVYTTEGVDGRDVCFMAERRGGAGTWLMCSEVLMEGDGG